MGPRWRPDGVIAPDVDALRSSVRAGYRSVMARDRRAIAAATVTTARLLRGDVLAAAGRPTLLVQEGGYNLAALGANTRRLLEPLATG